MLLPDTHIISNAALLSGIVSPCGTGVLEAQMKTPPQLPPKQKYTPIVYMLDEITPEKNQPTFEKTKSPEETVVVDLTCVTPAKSAEATWEKCKPLHSIGISAFGNMVTSSLPGNLPCES